MKMKMGSATLTLLAIFFSSAWTTSADGDVQDCLLSNGIVVEDGKELPLRCANCSCSKGQMSCFQTHECQGVCSVIGSQAIRTFDDSTFTIRSFCAYLLVKTDAFSVILNNGPCKEDPRMICIDSVEFNFQGKIVITINSTGEVTSSKGDTVMPLHFDDLLTVRKVSSLFMEVATTIGVVMQYDIIGGRVYVIVDQVYLGKTQGLCGTFNHNSNDDFKSANGLVEANPQYFVDSWKFHSSCPNLPPPNPSELEGSVGNCSFIESSFPDCVLVMNVNRYRQDCERSVFNPMSAVLPSCVIANDFTRHCVWTGMAVIYTECDQRQCGQNAVYVPDGEVLQRDCRSLTDSLVPVVSEALYTAGCVCLPGFYYDSVSEKCVLPKSCPCYRGSTVFQPGEQINKNCVCGSKCPPEEDTPCTLAPDVCLKHEVYDDCAGGTRGKACEPNCQNLGLLEEPCPTQCQPGCVCKPGYARLDGVCISMRDCPCKHRDELFYPGESITVDCNTCTCLEGMFKCTTEDCNMICNVYSQSQYVLFDQFWEKYPSGDCEIELLAGSDQGANRFSVSVKQDRCMEHGGAVCRKRVQIQFGSTVITMKGSDIEANGTDDGDGVHIYKAGFYNIVVSKAGFTVYYDTHLDIIIELSPAHKGAVSGMCGDADGSTRKESAVSALDFGKMNLLTECTIPPAPSTTEEHTKYIESRCSILRSKEFGLCHAEVNVDSYYSACVEESLLCKDGDSCLCFCTSIAAYSRACCRKGVPVEWRNSDLCPAPCEYYNRELGEGPFVLAALSGLVVVADFDTKSFSMQPYDAIRSIKQAFMITEGLYKDPYSSKRLVSFESIDHPNFFLVYGDDGSVSLKQWQSGTDFRKHATFLVRRNRWIKGYDGYESYVTRGNYLLAGDDAGVTVSNYIQGLGNLMSFQTKVESFSLPNRKLCTWSYMSCHSPCIKTCRDPTGNKCTLNLRIEGCFPECAPDRVFDETTHRCVYPTDCYEVPPSLTTPPPTLTAPAPTLTTPPPTRTTPPPVLTTPPRVTFTTPALTTKHPCNTSQCRPQPPCEQLDSRTVITKDASGCCDLQECVCPPCPDEPKCDEGIKPTITMTYTQCCPQYTCQSLKPPPTTPPSKETTPPSKGTTPPSKGTTPPSKETTAPSKETTLPVVTSEETTAPTTEGTTAPTTEETTAPTTEETTAPTSEETTAPTTEGTTAPTSEETTAPTTEETTAPTTEGTTVPTSEGTTVPTTEETTAPTSEETTAPTTEETTAPTSAKSTTNYFTPSPTTPNACSSVICPPKECQAGETVKTKPNPLDSCCPIKYCECESCPDIPQCSRDEKLVTVSAEGTCCPKLKCEVKKDECDLQYRTEKIWNGNCVATLEMPFCSGFCSSMHYYSPSDSRLVSSCSCCSAGVTADLSVQTLCPDNSSSPVIITVPKTCSCRPCG